MFHHFRVSNNLMLLYNVSFCLYRSIITILPSLLLFYHCCSSIIAVLPSFFVFNQYCPSIIRVMPSALFFHHCCSSIIVFIPLSLFFHRYVVSFPKINDYDTPYLDMILSRMYENIFHDLELIHSKMHWKDVNIFHDPEMIPSNNIKNWLVVGPPPWKIWVRQLGWLFPPSISGKIKLMASKPPTRKCRRTDLVGGPGPPLWKIWVRQLEWLFPIYGKIKNGNQTTNMS